MGNQQENISLSDAAVLRLMAIQLINRSEETEAKGGNLIQMSTEGAKDWARKLERIAERIEESGETTP